MKERPILFAAPMVRAILDGTKTQTRRLARLVEDGETTDVAVEMAAHTRDGKRGAVPVTLRSAWAVGWDAINAQRASWASNPWVWVVSFQRTEPAGGR